MKTFISVDNSKCTGCQRCEMACSYINAGVIKRKISRIKVYKDEKKGVFNPVVCIQCTDAKCVEACPKEALTRDNTGAIIFDSSKCISCKLCVKACPYGAMGWDGKFPFKCELCGGDAECVKECPVGALTLRRADGD